MICRGEFTVEKEYQGFGDDGDDKDGKDGDDGDEEDDGVETV